MDNQLVAQCEQVAKQWIDSDCYDAETKKAVKAMVENSDKTELIDSLIMLRDGFSLLGKVLLRLLDISVHRFPYAYICSIIIGISLYCAVLIMQARSERDAAIKKTYMVQQELDSLKVFNDIKKGGTYVQYED